jgi:hypothetical protein
MRKVLTSINNSIKLKYVYKCYDKIKNCSSVTGKGSEHGAIITIKPLYHEQIRAKNRCNNLRFCHVTPGHALQFDML